MRITADTNLLLRAIFEDDAGQAAQAQALISRSEVVAVPVPVLCELAWTMRRLYKRSGAEVAQAIESIAKAPSVATDRPAVEAGLAVLQAGGDFADGVIAWQGAALGGTVLATFDRDAVKVLNPSGLAAAEPAQLLSES